MSHKRIDRPRIYVAGALNAPAIGYLKNVHDMIKAGEKVRRKGFAVFVPCLDLLTGVMFGNLKYDDFFQNSVAWLHVCDAIFFLPNWHSSEGAKRERAMAHASNVPIFDDLETMVEYFEKRLGAGTS